MTEEQIKIGNKAIAEFMGYVYFESGIHTDVGDYYKDFQDVDVYSKVPIEVNDYPEDKQKYFKDLPNPDFGNLESKRWRSDLKTLGWDTLNSDNYKTKLTYDYDWNELMPVVDKIEKLDYVVIFHHNYCHIQTLNSYTKKDSDDLWFIEFYDEKIMAVYKAVVEFIKYYNEKNDKERDS